MTFPVKCKEEVLNVLGNKRLKRYYLSTLDLSDKTINEAASEVCRRSFISSGNKHIML